MKKSVTTFFYFFPEEMGDVVSEPGPAGPTVQLQPVTWHHSEHRTGSRLPAEEKVGTRGVFTLSGSGTKTGTGTRTIGDNRSLPLSWFKCNVEASTKAHTTNLFPVPVPVWVPASVNTLNGLWTHLHRNSIVQYQIILVRVSATEFPYVWRLL